MALLIYSLKGVVFLGHTFLERLLSTLSGGIENINLNISYLHKKNILHYKLMDYRY